MNHCQNIDPPYGKMVSYPHVLYYFTCREDNETLCHFFFDCLTFKPNFDSLLCNLLLKASNLNAGNETHVSQFITKLEQFHKMLLLLGCLSIPF